MTTVTSGAQVHRDAEQLANRAVSPARDGADFQVKFLGHEGGMRARRARVDRGPPPRAWEEPVPMPSTKLLANHPRVRGESYP